MQQKDIEIVLQLQQRIRELRATATFMIEEATNIEKELSRLYESDVNRLNIVIEPILTEREMLKLSKNALKKLSKASRTG